MPIPLGLYLSLKLHICTTKAEILTVKTVISPLNYVLASATQDMIQNHLSKSSYCIKTHPTKYYHLPSAYIQSNNFARNILLHAWKKLKAEQRKWIGILLYRSVYFCLLVKSRKALNKNRLIYVICESY